METYIRGNVCIYKGAFSSFLTPERTFTLLHSPIHTHLYTDGIRSKLGFSVMLKDTPICQLQGFEQATGQHYTTALLYEATEETTVETLMLIPLPIVPLH